ncbi:MAG: hypothetical protein EBE86_007230 [Hormoscilla sp. GUM202]|nr:hypothetical protein [Hormoscilla sp. GUM202]
MTLIPKTSRPNLKYSSFSESVKYFSSAARRRFSIVSDREFKARPTIFTEQLKHKSDCMRQKEAYIEIAQFFVVLRSWGRSPAKPNLQLMSRGGAIAWHLNARTKKPGFPQKPGFTIRET